MLKIFSILLVGLFLVPSISFAQYSSDRAANSLIIQLKEEIASLKKQLLMQDKKSSRGSESEIRTVEKRLKERRVDVKKHQKILAGKKCATVINSNILVAKGMKDTRACEDAQDKLESAISGVDTLSKKLELLKLLQ